MLSFSLAQIVRRTKNPRRSQIPIAPIAPTEALASDLYLRCYKPIISALMAALPALVAAYEYALPARSGTVHDAVPDVQPTLDALGEQLRRLVLNLVPGLSQWAAQVERWHEAQWRGKVLTATGVDLDTMLHASGRSTSVAETIAWNTSLIRDVSDQARNRIGSSVFAAFQQRRPAAELATELREGVDLSRGRSLRIASDQLQKLAAALDTERMKEAGIGTWTWRHSHKAHPRAEHVARDGKWYTFNDPPPDMPGELPYCGCRKQAVIDLG